MNRVEKHSILSLCAISSVCFGLLISWFWITIFIAFSYLFTTLTIGSTIFCVRLFIFGWKDLMGTQIDISDKIREESKYAGPR